MTAKAMVHRQEMMLPSDICMAGLVAVFLACIFWQSALFCAAYFKAERGDAEARMEVARSYLAGKGVAQNDWQATKWILKAIEMKGTPDGIGHADYLIAMIYSGGRYGMAVDVAQQIKWLEKSARAGFDDAMMRLGQMYMGGMGVAPDKAEAYKWLTLSAATGDSLAKNCLHALINRMTPAQVAEGKKRVAEWKGVKV